MQKSKFSLKGRIKSFTYAFSGLKTLVKEEHNSRIHIAATIFVAMAGFAFKISVAEWIAVILCIGFVFALEIVNSAIENLSDFVCGERNETIKKVKDLSAAATLVAAITSIIVGLFIFAPKVIALCSIYTAK